jgi:hypothetical protein
MGVIASQTGPRGPVGARRRAERLSSQAQCLWESMDASWESLLRRRFVATLGAAALEAICDLCPEIDAFSLIVDTDPGTTPC